MTSHRERRRRPPGRRSVVFDPFGRCRDCGRGVLWFPTPRGRRIALDVEPDEQGDRYIAQGVAHRILPGIVVPDDATRYRCHFDTCPLRRTPAA